MKCEVRNAPGSTFVPQRVDILLETLKELQAFQHLLGCWEDQDRCGSIGEVRALASAVKKTLPWPLA